MMSTNEPILILAFNRPDHLTRLLDQLRQVEPERIFVAIDGPRRGREGEQERVMQCRALVNQIDWNCEVETLFQDENLGCGKGVSTAISWFFTRVERGIILEDDVIPDPSFFGFCSELLDRYQMDERVFAISGNNLVPLEHLTDPAFSYRFSRIPHIWGWATWKRSWDKHDLDITHWRRRLPIRKLLRRMRFSLSGTLFWTATFELLARNQVDTWDGQLVLAALSDDQWIATSNINLVENIGFGEDATHTLRAIETPPRQSIDLPTKSPRFTVDERADAWTRKHHFKASIPNFTHQAVRFAASKFRGNS